MINPKLKVAIVSNSLAIGGAERFASLLSKMLENESIEIYNIIINDFVNFDYKGELYNLGKVSKSKFSILKKIEKGFLLRRYLKKNGIQLIIDNRPRNHFLREFFTILIYGNRKKWFVIHSFNLRNYFPWPEFLSKKMYQKADRLICVSNAIETLVIRKFKFLNTITIYNPYDISKVESDEVNESEKFILFFGRFDEKAKNFTLMLDAFLSSEIYHLGYSLYLLGEGPDLSFIKEKIKDLKLEKFVKIISFRKNPYEYISKARCSVLTSRYEGFPMSVIESLAIGTPVVSVDCKSGPNEIITSGWNGLLVENYNTRAFSEALKRMVHEEDLYQTCKNNALKSVEHLSVSAIADKWKNLILSIK
jgi:glycosyltransferase involved in cell wall biosynthesis